MTLTAIHIALYIIWVFYFTFMGYENVMRRLVSPFKGEYIQSNTGKFLDSLFILLTSYLIWVILL